MEMDLFWETRLRLLLRRKSFKNVNVMKFLPLKNLVGESYLFMHDKYRPRKYSRFQPVKLMLEANMY